jgi:hypothetical protein
MLIRKVTSSHLASLMCEMCTYYNRQTPVQVLDDYVYFPLAIDVHSSSYYILTSSKGFDSNGCEGKLWDTRKGQVRVIITYIAYMAP